MLKTFLYKVVLRSVLLLIVLTEVKSASAQTYTMTNGSVSTCSGTFLDPGGNANYPNNANYTYTICSSNGTQVNAKFTLFKTSANDVLYVYDGNSITAPLMGTYTGSLTYPPSLTSSSTCLTFKFVSDATTNNTGFSATISCIASTIKVDNTTYTQSQLISSVFMGDCLTATNIQFHGMNDMMGYFSNGNSIGIPTGVVLTSGSIFNVPGPNNQANATIDHSQPGDVQLTSAVGVNTQDASSIEFDFVPKNDSVTFQFVFASEEYPEWICQGYNDAFGFFVTGTGYAANTNVALIPGTTTPIAIDNINTTGSCTTIYPQYYVNNTGGTACQYDGYTVPMNCVIHCVPCETYHIKIAVADVGDGLYDSGVFLKAQSFSAGHNITVSATGQNGVQIYEGCDGYFTFTNLDGVDSLPYNIYYQILGTASNGNDYQTITNMVTIPAGQTTVTLPINTILDANVETSEWVRVKLLTYCNCSNIPQATLIIQDNSAFNATVTAPQTICQGQVPLTLTASGSQSLPYHYLWSTGATTKNISVSPSVTTTYSVTVTNPCDGVNDFASTTVTVIPALSITPIQTNVNCSGNNNGSISLAVTGGQTLCSYLWSNGATTANISGLTPNTYSVTVTAGVCSTTSTYTITQPTSLGLSLSSVNPACNGVSNGSVSSAVTGGTSPFNYLWNNGATTANRSSLAAGTYSLTVTDANGCTNSATATITNTTSISVSASSTNAICFGGNSGTASSIVSGGTSPFTYHWSNNATTSNISSLIAATYSLTVTDANGCTATASTTVSQPTALSVSASSTNVSCNAGTNGTAILTVTGGTSPYSYLWNNGVTTANRTSLSAGTYSLTVTDANGCTATASTTVSQPTTFTVSTSSTNALCNAAANGTATSSVTGGTSPFTYAWSNGATTANITSLTANTYSVIVTDVNGCTATASTTVSQPATLSVSTSSTNALCNAASNGTATSSVTGGTSPFTYAWSNGATTANITSLTANTYSVIVTDANGCTATSSTTVSQPTTLSVSTSSTNALCNAAANGTATSSVTGGTSPFTYAWSNGATTANISSLTANSYSVIVSDANGCTATSSTTVSQPTTLSVSTSSTNALCNAAANGTATSSVTGGTSPFTYAWSNGATTANITSLTANTYSVVVTDANGCTATTSTTVSQPTTLSVSTSSTNALCNAAANGTATSSVTGGTSPFTYAWSNGATTANITSLTANTYSVIVTDANGCTATSSTTVLQPTTLSVSTSSTNALCNAAANGTATSSVTGGTSPFTYTWSNGATTANITSLTANTYSVVVTDANGCTATTSTTVSQPTTLSVSTSSTNALCNAAANGTATSSVTGGTSPLTYAWSNGATTANITSLTANTYSVIVTDANGCTATASTTVSQPTTLSVSTSSTNALCNAAANGTATSSVTGGTSPFTYTWSNGATTANITSLTANTYSVVVTDANGCTATTSTTVSQPTTLSVSTSSTNALCNAAANGTATSSVTGGTSPFTYAWSNGATTANISSLTANSYSVIVSDANGCTATSSTTVIQPTTLSVSTSSTNALCNAAANGTATSSVTGGTSPFTYAWSNGATTANITSLTANTYSVIVTDANGCTATSSRTVSQPTTLSVSTSSTNALCNSAANGTATSSVTGGTSPFTYAWSNGATTANITSLTANTYSVIVTDANGCTATSSTTVSQPTTLSVSTSSTNALCNAAANGTATSSVTGGTSPFTYAWSNGATTANISSLTANSYSVIVSDANGCTATSSTTVSQPTTLSVSTSSTNALCNAAANGTATSSVTGGTSPFTYAWSNGATTANITSLTANTYSVIVTDANGCTATSSTTVSQPTTLSVSTSSTNALCNAAANGTATSSVTGGTSPFTYAWSNGATTANISSLTANSYSVIVSDANGCTATSSTTVIQPTTLSVSTSSTNALCNAAANGTATSSVTGGTSPFTYAWSNGATTANISSLTGNSYSVIVSDANGCTATSSTTVSQPTTLSVSTSSTNALCNAAANGTATSSVTGGTSPFTYAWSNGATTANITSLTANTYSVIVTDANGCTATSSTTVSQPTTLSVSTSSTNALCNAAANGTATSSVTGGTSPFTYAWSNGATTANITSLTANTYSVIVTDANGCTATSSTTVSQPTTLSVSTSSTNALCNAAANGTATSSVTGGTSPFTYAWSNGATTANISSLTANSYSVIVSDANGCTATSSTTVSQPTTLSVSTSSTNALCNAAANGTATSSVTGGTSPFTYAWSNGATTANITSLTANTYSVIVTDANGCTATSSTTVSQPTILSVSEIHNDATCSLLNGNVSLTTSGGTTPYSYAWSNSATTDIINNLSPSNYSVTVQDANTCSVTLSINIVNSSSPVASTVNAAICNGTSYTLPNGTSVTAAGTYTSTLTSVIGCDSVITTNLIVNPVYASTVNAAICTGASYTLPNGTSVIAAGTYTSTLTSVSGCDSVITTNLAVNPVYASTVNAAICNGATYTLPNGTSVTAAGTYTSTLTSVSGCDSVITTNLTVNPVYASTVNAAICNGATYTLPNGASVNAAGTYTSTLTSISGCDSVITTNLIVNPVYASTVNAAICNGATYTLPNGTSVTAAGTYTSTLTSVSGCDSVITTNLIVNPVYASTVNAAICNGATYTLPNGTSVTAAGTYTSTLTSISGCDSVITTNLTVNPVYASTVNAAICNGATYTLPNGASVNAAGTYTSTLTSISGCDSVITTNLIVNPVYASTVNAAICNGASYTLPNGTSVIAAGTYTSTLTSVSGCDSVITTNLIVNPVYASTVNAAICNGATYTLPNGTSVTAAGTYTSTLTSVSGCDSVITTNLTVNPVYASTVNAAICNGATYTLPNGASVNAAGTYTSTLTSISGCDSVITTNLAVNPVYAATVNAAICNGATYTLPNGTSVTAAGTYTSTLTSVSGCDSVITTNLIVNPVYASTVNAAICDGATYTLPNGASVNAAGTYTSTLTSISGCDSVITTNLAVNPVYAATVNAAICNGATYTLPNGTSVTAAGTYTSTLTSVSGCDSVITTNLSVNSVFAAAVNAQICNGASYTLPNGASINSAGQYITTLTSVSGCDSVITTNLIVNPVYASTVNAAICNGASYTLPNGTSVTAAGTYTSTLTSVSGCDSVITTNLIVNPVYAATVNAAICNGATYTLPNGTSVTAAGQYITTLTSVSGCDSVITTNLIVNPVYASTVNAAICNGASYTLPSGTSVTAAGTYTSTLTSISGCDSVITTNLIVNPVYASTVNAAICNGASYTLPNGTSVTAAGTYTSSLTSISGCDSVITTNLIVNPVYTSTVNTAICNGASYTLPNGTSVSAAGTYTSTLTSISGCDSVITTNLTVNPVYASTVNAAICNGATYTLPNGASVNAAGTYTSTLTSVSGCDSVITTNLIVNPVYASTVNAAICNGASYTLPNGASINSAGQYITTLTSVSGCDSVITTNLIVNPVYASTVNAAICNGATYTLPNGTSVTATGTYTSTLTSVNGCDSVITTNLIVNPVYAATVNAAICNGASYTLPNGASINSAGQYITTLTSVGGCDSVITTNLSVSGFTLSAINTNSTCGLPNGNINLSIVGGIAPFNYSWSNGSTNQDLQNISSGNYAVTVTDNSGCASIFSTVLNNIGGVIGVNLTVNYPTCTVLTNGSVVASGTGSTSPYTYHWSTGSNLPFIFGVAMGNYTLTVTSASGCSLDTTVIIPSPVPIFVIDSVVPSVCGNYAAELFVMVSGGSMPYLFHWSNGATTEDLLYVNGGVYNLTVTDSHNCMGLLSVNIPNILLPYLAETHIDASCGNATGSIDLVPSGGNLPYHFQWSNGQTTEDATNLLAGVYTVTAFDANGCTSSLNVTINNSNGPVLSETHQDDYCAHSIASIDLTISGGATPYQINWSNGSTTEDLNNISSGNYSVTVVDANGCSVTTVINVNGLNGQTVSLTAISPMCNGASNGSVTVDVLGGVPNLNFAWSNGMTSQNLNNVGAGNYSITVTDGFGCVVSGNTTLINPSAIIASTVNAQICSGGNYVLPSGASTSSAGQYITTLTSVSGCDSVITTNLSVNSILTSTVNAQICSGGNYVLPSGASTSSAGQYITTLTSVSGCDSVITTNLSVNSILTSTVNAQICSGGNYVLPSGASTSSAGQYITTLTSVSGCDSVITTNLSVNSILTSTVNAQICSGGNYVLPNGSSVNAAGQYITTLTSVSGCDSVITTNLSVNSILTSTVNAQICSGGNYILPNGSLVNTAGTYTSTLTSVNGCDSVITTNLSVNPILTSTVNAQICSGGNYVLPSGASTSSAGQYITTLTSVSGCDSVITTNLSVNSILTSTVNAQICSGGNYVLPNGSSVNAAGQYITTLTSVSGCDSVITTNLSVNSILTSTVNAQICSGGNYILPNGSLVNTAGTYTSTLTSVNGCDSVITTNLSVNSILTSTVNAQICFGGNYVLPNGTSVNAAATYTTTLTSVSGCDSVITTNLSVNSILTSTVNAQICSGGNYVLPNGTSVNTAGTYTSTLTSVSGCDSVITTILNVGSPTASESHSDAACGMANASINLTVSGGISPYNYTWSNGATTANISMLSANNYLVTVTDNNSCQSILSVNISNINGPMLTENHVNSSCGNPNGAVDLTVTGGVPPMNFIWSNAAVSEDINNIPQGIYSVTVSDANNCVASLNISIGGNNIPAVSETHIDASCNGNNGSVNLTVGGGAPIYTYIWSNGTTTEDQQNLSSGNYLVTVTDANTCKSILSVNISNQISTLAIGETHVAPVCGQSNGSIDVTVSGGVTPYDYEWDNNATTEDLSGITAGIYTIEVEDAVGCQATLPVAITCVSAPPCLLSVNASAINTSCSNPNSGGANLLITNSVSSLSYLWSNGHTTQNLNSIAAGNYSVTVNDAIGCSATTTVNVLNTNGPSVIDSHANTSCGNSNGSINLTVGGGASPYNYLWTNGFTTQNLINLSAGDYFVTASDLNNCIATLHVYIENSTATTLIETHANASCGNNNGSIDLTVTSGVAPYSFIWNSGATAEDPINMTAGNYIVTVTDAFACTASSSITISNTSSPNLSETHVDASCGNFNGSINLTVNGGTSPYSYQWNNFSTTQDITNLMTGNYLVTVSDANNCIAIMSVLIDNLSGPSLNVSTANPSCGQNNGAIDLQVNGGIPPYTFSWINGATTSTLTNLSAGNYAVTVSDQSGCSLFTTTSLISTSSPSIILNSISSTICVGNATTISASGATTYAWSPSAGLNVTTGSSVTANPAVTTTYTVTGNTSGGCSATSTIVITVTSNPIISVAPTTSFICAGGSTTITASGASTYSWSPSSSLSSATSATVTASPNNTTTYTVTGTSNGCSAQATTVVNLISATTINLNTIDTAICLGNSVVITASGSGTNYTWSPSSGLSATTGNSVSANPIATTVYNVVSTNAGGCSSSANVLVNVNALPSVNVSSNNNSICAGGTVVMNASGAGTYSWSPSIGLNSNSGTQVVATPNNSITYTVTGIDLTSGCSAQATTVISIIPAPTVTVSASSISICAGQNTILTASGANAYAWYPSTGLSATNGASVIAIPDSNMTYMVVGSVPTGCTDTASISITVGTLPDIIVDVLPDEGCEPLTVTFDNHTTGAASFDWSFGDSNSSTNVSPVHTYTSQGTYPVSLVVTSAAGCSDTLSNLATIKVHPTPIADFTVNPALGVVTTINDATFTFLNHSTNATNYKWFFGDGATDTYMNTSHTYLNSGEFNVTLIASADYDCADTLTLYPIMIVEDGTVFIPNAFTPNGDGINEVFNIFGTGIQHFTLTIFDRLGEMVYQGDEASAGWDATFKGQPVNLGVFVYVADITYDDGTKANKKGDVTVVR